MYIPESKLRVWGYLVMTTIFFVFFMLEMFFSWKDQYMLPKVFFITVLHTGLIWEPTRFAILQLRRQFPGLAHVRRRIAYAVLLLVPYAFLLGFARIYLEDVTYLWNVSVASFSAYSYTIGISLLFICLQVAVYESLYFFYQWNKSRVEADELKKINYQMQIDALKGQIQPHFLFNTLNTLIGLIEVNATQAVKFTESLAYVYRYFLEANDRMLVSLEEELAFAQVYFSLLKTRYADGIHLHSNIGDSASFMLPPLSLQLLIENAVKHNAITRASPLYIEMNCDSEKHCLQVTNNLQAKTDIQKSGKGLSYLKKKFELLDLPPVRITKNNGNYTVCLPLIKKYQYESIDC